MRSLIGFLIIPALAVCGGMAAANPSAPPETRVWHFDTSGLPSYREIEPNETCVSAQTCT